jgi:hypothetical protein
MALRIMLHHVMKLVSVFNRILISNPGSGSEDWLYLSFSLIILYNNKLIFGLDE